MTRIAFLGLGAMGSRMAARLVDAGHQVTVWNRSPAAVGPLRARGAVSAGSPRAAAASADVVFSMVRDDEAAWAVWLDPETGALGGMANGSVAVECSTVTPGWARQLHEACSVARISCLDAPVAGSRPQAEAGQLIFLAGGEEAVLRRVEPVLKAMGGAVHLAGAAGAGAGLKLLVNALFGIQVAAVAELFGLARLSGLDPACVMAIVAETPAASPAARVAIASMTAQSFAPLFPTELVRKDFGYAQSQAPSLERVPLIAATLAVLDQAVDRGWGSDNLTGIVRLYD